MRTYGGGFKRENNSPSNWVMNQLRTFDHEYQTCSWARKETSGWARNECVKVSFIYAAWVGVSGRAGTGTGPLKRVRTGVERKGIAFSPARNTLLCWSPRTWGLISYQFTVLSYLLEPRISDLWSSTRLGKGIESLSARNTKVAVKYSLLNKLYSFTCSN